MNSMNSVKNAAPLENFTSEMDEVMCFKNMTFKLYFQYFPKNLDVSSGTGSLPLEADVWPMIGDLINYLNDLQ